MCIGGIWSLFYHLELPESCRQVMEVVALDTPAPPVCPHLTDSPPPQTKGHSLRPGLTSGVTWGRAVRGPLQRPPRGRRGRAARVRRHTGSPPPSKCPLEISSGVRYSGSLAVI